MFWIGTDCGPWHIQRRSGSQTVELERLLKGKLMLSVGLPIGARLALENIGHPSVVASLVMNRAKVIEAVGRVLLELLLSASCTELQVRRFWSRSL